MKDNGIIKLSKHEDFTMCQNDIIRHVGEGMSAKALGVYMVIKYYINIPNFTLHKDHIQRVSGEGKKAFETVWKELKELGYIIQSKTKTSDGKWAYEYTLFSSREEVEKNKKASTDGQSVKALKENIQSDNSIPQSDKKDTKKEKENLESIPNSEVVEVIKKSCVNIKKEDLKYCEEEFTDINKLKEALTICEINNSHGIKALRMAYKYGDRNNNYNTGKGASSGVNDNFKKYGDKLESHLRESQEGKFDNVQIFNPNFTV